MLDIIAVSLSSFAAGAAIGFGPALFFRAEARRAVADADRLRGHLALTMVDREAWRSRALRSSWLATLPEIYGATNVVSLDAARARRARPAIPDGAA